MKEGKSQGLHLEAQCHPNWSLSACNFKIHDIYREENELSEYLKCREPRLQFPSSTYDPSAIPLFVHPSCLLAVAKYAIMKNPSLCSEID
jgi:hypothetical protein